MPRLIRGASFLSAVTLAMLVVSVCVVAGDTLRDRLIKEMKKAKRSPRSINLRMQIDSFSEISDTAIEADYSPQYLERLKQKGEDPKKQQKSIELAYYNKCIMRKEYRDGDLAIICKNDQYAFSLFKDKEAQSFVLVYAGQLGDDPRTDKIIKQEEQKAQQLFTGPWTVAGEYFPDLASKPGFRFLDVKEVEQNGRKLIRADFEYLVEENERYNPSLYDAYIICDPALRWAIVEQGVTRKYSKIGSEIRHTITINDIKLYEGIPLGEKTISATKWVHKNGETDLTTISREMSEDVLEEEFYLSHYGLPEPNFEMRWSSSWLFYLLTVLFCFGVGYWVYRQRSSAA